MIWIGAKTDLEGKLEMPALLQEGDANPVGGLAVGRLQSTCQAEVLECLLPLFISSHEDPAVELHLGAPMAHLGPPLPNPSFPFLDKNRN